MHGALRRVSWIVVLVSACVARLALAQGVDHCTALAGVARCSQGFDESGGRYVFVVPDAWNGALVVYSKGSGAILSGDRASPQFMTFRDDVVREGYAFAYRDFAEEEHDYRINSQQTHRLPQRFALETGKPAAVYLVGESRGGLLSIDLAETYPEQYAGALVQCAPALGFTVSTGWRVDVRVLFDYFFGAERVHAAGIPRILETPLDSTSATYSSALFGLLREPGAGALLAEIASVMRFPHFPPNVRGGRLEYFGNEACVTGQSALENAVVSPILFLMNQDRRLLAEERVRSFYDNSETVYTGSHDDVALNAGVQRLQGNRSAMNHHAKYYTPTGDLRIPVLLLYNRFDPLGSLGMQEGYADLVASAGRSHLLARWSVDRSSHCWFAESERLAAFHALTSWAASGSAPPSGSAEGSPPSCLP